ncbi:isoprenyl transferase [Vallitalea okinawensis]|uniref:isoprenyl transferase n=1 Tax=Vallitalea okinawensis TaxID=2078660 RepID=UPI000CFB3522|nr:isoprenyl transferase [Vallitalea okinawensis]
MSKNWYNELDKNSIPKHIAVIMDGNGRWARERNKLRMEGHKEGSKTLKKVTDAAIRCGIKYMTVYAFSTENWSRPEKEVSYLMNLLRQGLDKYRKDAMDSDIKISVIGDISRLDDDLKKKIANVVKATQHHRTFNLVIAINYGSRDEIVRAVKKVSQDIKEGSLMVDEIDEHVMDKHLDTKDFPDPDLLIRTSGEQRLSNYLLWQLAYAEFYFTETKWPDFDAEELYKAIYYYQTRDRRFGAI